MSLLIVFSENVGDAMLSLYATDATSGSALFREFHVDEYSMDDSVHQFYRTFGGAPVEIYDLNDAVTIRTTLSPVYARALSLLQEFSSFEENWDSYGSSAIPETALDEAREFLAELSSKDQVSARYVPNVVVPLGYGGVQMEWAIPHGLLEIEIDSDRAYSYLVVRRTEGKRESEERTGISRKAAIQKLSSFV